MVGDVPTAWLPPMALCPLPQPKPSWVPMSRAKLPRRRHYPGFDLNFLRLAVQLGQQAVDDWESLSECR